MKRLVTKMTLLIALAFFLGEKTALTDPVVKGQTELSRFSAGVSYFGDMIAHPGFLLSGGYVIYSKSWFDLLAGVDLGMYRHIKYQIAAFADVGIAGRATSKIGLFFDLAGGVGYLHSWPDGKIYTIDHNGKLVEKTNTGNPNLMIFAHTGFGWNFGKNGLLPLSLFTAFWIFGEYPQNTAMVMHLALQVGASYAF